MNAGHRGRAAIRLRARLAWNVMRDRPVAYRLHVVDGTVMIQNAGSWIANCTFESTGKPRARGRVRRFVDRIATRMHRWAVAA